MIDRTTRWPEAIPVPDITAETITRNFFTHWVARFGVPVRVTTDQGRQFEADLFRRLTQLTGSQHWRTTAYHPAANGMVERFHRQMKAAIIFHQTADWTEILPVILLGIRSAYKEDLRATPAEMVYGEAIRLPGKVLSKEGIGNENSDTLVHTLRKAMRELQPQPVKRHGTTATFVHKDLDKSSHVFVRRDAPQRALQPTYDGPYEVMGRTAKVLRLNIKGRTTNISVDRVKPAYTLKDQEATTSSTEDQANGTHTRSGRLIKPTVRFTNPTVIQRRG